MNKQVMELWVKALRSGKYRKGRNRLCTINKNGTKKWCCLGVLCDLYNEHHQHPLQSTVKHDYWVGKSVVFYDRINGETPALLPPEVQEWAGMSSENGHFSTESIPLTSLATLNDCTIAKRSFKRMADIIEKNWEQL